MRVVKLLVGHPPRTVAELIDETGVTRTAVTEQLNEMVAAGFVEQTTEKLPGRGRPRHLYSATKAALVLLFANNQQLVVPAIWKAIHHIGGEKLTKKVLRSVGRSLARHYAERITGATPQKRVEQFLAILEEEGGMTDMIRKDGHLTVTKRTCAFISMFDDQENVSRLTRRCCRQSQAARCVEPRAVMRARRAASSKLPLGLSTPQAGSEPPTHTNDLRGRCGTLRGPAQIPSKKTQRESARLRFFLEGTRA